MQRTTIYLDDRQLELLRSLSESRGETVAALVREAVDTWLRAEAAHRIPRDEWESRFEALLRRRDRIAKDQSFTEEEVERDVMEAIRGVRTRLASDRQPD
jgi:hypothetical protein